jgi:hypothetical protein
MSYGKAKSSGIEFIRLNESLPYEEVIENLQAYLKNTTSDIPEDELFKRR